MGTSCAPTVLLSRVGCVGGVSAPRVKTSVSIGKFIIHFDIDSLICFSNKFCGKKVKVSQGRTLDFARVPGRRLSSS